MDRGKKGHRTTLNILKDIHEHHARTPKNEYILDRENEKKQNQMSSGMNISNKEENKPIKDEFRFHEPIKDEFRLT